MLNQTPGSYLYEDLRRNARLSNREAAELTAECTLALGNQKNPKSLTDRKFTSFTESILHPSRTG